MAFPASGNTTYRSDKGAAIVSTDHRARGVAGWSLLVILAGAVFALDQLTKSLVAQSIGAMGPGYYVSLFSDFVRLVYATNTGAAFSMFTDRTAILTVIAVAAIPLLLFGHRYLPVGGWSARICIGLLLGGTVGNLSDRIQYGYVVDFISVGFGALRWPTFNVADSSFVVGVLLIVLLVLLKPEPVAERNAA